MKWWATAVTLGLILGGAGPARSHDLDRPQPPPLPAEHDEIVVGDGEVIWFTDPTDGGEYVAEQPTWPAAEPPVVTVVYEQAAAPDPWEASYLRKVEEKLQRRQDKLRRKEAVRRYKVSLKAAKLDFKAALTQYKIGIRRWELAQRHGWASLGYVPADTRRPVPPRWEDYEPPPFDERAAPTITGRTVTINWSDGQRTEVPLD